MANKTYYVDPERTLTHDGNTFNGGAKITLDPEDTNTVALLEGGIISEKRPLKIVVADLEAITKERDDLKTQLEAITSERDDLKLKYVK
jgi:hypothetical protein